VDNTAGFGSNSRNRTHGDCAMARARNTRAQAK
jgi:hypothetical protein